MHLRLVIATFVLALVGQGSLVSCQGSFGRKLSEANTIDPSIAAQGSGAPSSLPIDSLSGSQIQSIQVDDVEGTDTLPVTEGTSAAETSGAPTEASFCGKSEFTLDDALAYGASVRMKGSKPLGFHGAPYASLAPWTCEGKVPTSSEVPQRIPGPRERLLKAGAQISNRTVGSSNVQQFGIQYHGGFVTNPLQFYYIWYGDWAVGDRTPSDTSTVKILEDLAYSLPGSCPWSSTASYQEGSGTSMVNQIGFLGSVFLPRDSPCWQGERLTYAKISKLTACLLEAGVVQPSPTTLFLTLGSGGIAFDGFCTQWCGWHDYANDTVIGYIGSNAKCPSGCTAQASSPNNNVEADSMASIIFHELTETATDPHIDAWYRDDENQNENADLCAWTFKPTAPTPSPGGGKWNTYLTCPPNTNCVSRYWLLQKNWANIGPNGVCRQGAFVEACPPGSVP